METSEIELGDIVKHSISGFTGTAICRAKWLSGCDRVTVQPTIDKDGKMSDNSSFDEPELVIVKKGKPRPAVKTGGPREMCEKQADATR